jgi:hypothetical protein
MADRIRIALLSIAIGFEAALLPVAVGIFRLLLFLALIFLFLLLALDVLLVLQIAIGHDASPFLAMGESRAHVAGAPTPESTPRWQLSSLKC